MLTVQRQRRVQRQDETAVSVPRKGSQTPADQILELKHEVQRRARLAVSVPREGSQTLVKSRLELRHQTPQRKQCQLLDLSLLQDHDDTFRGTGHLLHYRVHPKAPALRC